MPQTLADSRPILSTELPEFGGAERSLLVLSHWLHKQGLAHYLLTYRDSCNIAKYANFPVSVVELKPEPGVRNKIASLRKHFKERGLSAFRPLTSGYQSALHATLAGQQGSHCLMHDTVSLMGGPNGPRRYNVRMAVSNRIIRYGFRNHGKMIVTSEFLRFECQRDFGVDAEIVRMGGFGTAGSPRIRPVHDKLRMLSVSRIEWNKRLDWILRSLAELEKAPIPLSARVDWRVDFVGKGSQIPALNAMAAALGIADRVCFHGFLPDSEVEALFGESHLFLMPAIQGYGIPAIEALQRGLPILLHRESGVSDILLETPWATVLGGGESSMVGAMREAINKVIEGRHHCAPLPTLPTEDSWAEQVARLCDWAV